MSSNPIDNLAERGQDFEVKPDSSGQSTASSFLTTLKSLNIKKLIKEGVLSPENPEGHLYTLVEEGLGNTLFRKSQRASETLANLWVSKLYQSSKSFFLKNPRVLYRHGSVTSEFLTELAQLSHEPKAILQIPHLLLEKGIIFLIEPYITGSDVDGACFKMPNGIPVIGISLRYSRLDNFWFTLLHELAHVVLHYDQLDSPIVDDLDNLEDSRIEKQANNLAKFSIVSKSEWRTCEARFNHTNKNIFTFARRNKIHPALVAGLIRHELRNYKLFNDIIHDIDVRALIADHT